jgi:hypothetical protein
MLFQGIGAAGGHLQNGVTGFWTKTAYPGSAPALGLLSNFVYTLLRTEVGLRRRAQGSGKPA